MAPPQPSPTLRSSLTPELQSIAIKRTQSLLLRAVRPNLNTQYASKAPALAELRDAISAHGSSSDRVLVDDFRRCVPLTDYDAYKPFMVAFEKHPCKEAEVENLFAPGLPLFLAASSATSGRAPKFFPKYQSSVPAGAVDVPESTAMILYYGYADVKEVEREPGSIVRKIPVSITSSGTRRARLGWANIDEDDSRMSLIMPSSVAPWAASMISNHRSFLVVHALFTLARRDVACIAITFSTMFYDLVRHIDEEWDVLLSCIRNGTVPDLPGVREVESHLQAHLHANPERAAELGEIGPPSSCEGWAARVWPKLKLTVFICSGPFASVVPKVKAILGPTVTLRSPGYTSSESLIAAPHRPDDLDTFVLRSNNLVEFLDVTAEESHKNILQEWEVEPGKQYEIVLTTTDGLWRYQLGDIINVLGFDPDNGSPVFAISGRKSLGVRLGTVTLTDAHLTPAIQAVSPDIMQVNEFTTVRDDRQSTETVGYFVELPGTLGPNAHLALVRLGESLAAANIEFRRQLKTSKVCNPTVRIVRPGTFAEYRQWRAEKLKVGPGQIKVPVVLVDATSREWILGKVAEEL